MKKIAIMASGSGSNAEALLDNYFNEKNLHHKMQIKAIITDKKEAFVLERAKKFPVSCYAVPYDSCPEGRDFSKKAHERKILSILNDLEVNWIFLAGYMRLLSQEFLNHFYESDGESSYYRVLNIHPSLLPSFPGISAYKDAFDYGVKISGSTVHFVDEGVDTGPILLQTSFKRESNDTLEAFSKRGLSLEHKLYVNSMHIIANDNFVVHKKNVELRN